MSRCTSAGVRPGRSDRHFLRRYVPAFGMLLARTPRALMKGDRNPPPRLVGPGGLVIRCRNAGGRDLTSLQPAGRAPEPRDPSPPALAAAEPDRPVRGPRRPGTLPRFRPGAVLVVPEPADAARRLYLRVRRRLQGPL